jgi:rubredoxin
MSEDPDLTPAQSAGYRAYVYCPRCRAFKDLDLLAFKVAGTEHRRWADIFPRLKCSVCGARPNFLWVGIDGAPGVKKFAAGSN